MRVKFFESLIEEGGKEPRIEIQMNKWLADNPNLQVIDVKLSANFASRDELGGAFYQVLAMVLYGEKGKG